jgi:hypothetical protein
MSFIREIAQLTQNYNIGLFEPVPPKTAADRTIWVGDLPESAVEAIWLVEVPSPPPHSYIDTEYPVIDFWSRSPHSDRGHLLLEQVFNNFHRRYGYRTANWTIYFSHALGNIVDVDRNAEGGKLYRLSVQFFCRNLNNLS